MTGTLVAGKTSRAPGAPGLEGNEAGGEPRTGAIAIGGAALALILCGGLGERRRQEALA